MNRACIIKRTFALLLAVLLAGMPLSPVFAASGEAHAAPAAHESGQRAHSSTQTDYGSKTCTQHDSCVGQCCGCCAHCFGAVSLFQPADFPMHPVQTPGLSQLHSLVFISSPDRPPRLISL